MLTGSTFYELMTTYYEFEKKHAVPNMQYIIYTDFLEKPMTVVGIKNLLPQNECLFLRIMDGKETRFIHVRYESILAYEIAGWGKQEQPPEPVGFKPLKREGK